MDLPGRSDDLRAAIRERALLFVTGGAGLGVVARQARIVEEVPTELGLRLRHGIGRGHARLTRGYYGSLE
jgi:hypothetical protein